MDRSYPYSRRLLTRARLRKRMAAVVAAGLLGAAAVCVLTWKPDPIAAAVPTPFMPAPALDDPFGTGEVQRGVRRIYPYSVVPGGVSSQSELQRVIRTDRVVAAHYATFDAGKARSVVVDKPRAVHVSYRKGDQVYWTAHKVMLAPGETLLSDGRNEMRARCANRISDLPQYPVEAHRPAMEELDHAVELAEGEEYALGPDGLPVAVAADGSIPRHTAMRFPTRGGSGSAGSAGGSAATPASGTLAGSLSSSASGIGPVTTMGLSGISNSMGSRPRPSTRPAVEPAAPATPESNPDAGTGSSGASSGAPAPSTGDPVGAEPVTSEPVTAGPVTNPVPDTTASPGTPAPGPGTQTPLPIPLPGTDPAPLPVTEISPSVPVPTPAPPTNPQPSQPGPITDPVAPKPTPEPIPPQPIEQPAPVEVPEPGSLWLFGLALAAMAVLRRRRS